MASKAEKDRLPILRPTPLTWGYVAFAVAVILLTVWGFIQTGAP